MELDDTSEVQHGSLTEVIDVEPLDSIRMDDTITDEAKIDVSEDRKVFSYVTSKFLQKSAMISCIRSDSACRNYHREPNLPSKCLTHYPGGRSKHLTQKQVEVKFVGKHLASKEAQEELFAFEESKNQASIQLNSLSDEIGPAIEEHERDSQDSVPTSVAEKWIEATCCKRKAEFDVNFSVIKHLLFAPRRPHLICNQGENDNEIKFLEMGPAVEQHESHKG